MAANHTINEPSSTPRARSRLLLLTAASLLIASCSGGSEASTTPTVLLTSTAPTTVATTTTTQATTTTEDPAIAYKRDVAEITEVYRLLVSYLGTYGLNADRELIAEFAAEPLLTLKYDNTAAWAEQGLELRDIDYDFQIVETTFDGDSATSVSCDFDRGNLVTSDGEVVIPTDTERYLVTTTFERTSEGWRATDTDWGDLVTCDA